MLLISRKRLLFEPFPFGRLNPKPARAKRVAEQTRSPLPKSGFD